MLIHQVKVLPLIEQVVLQIQEIIPQVVLQEVLQAVLQVQIEDLLHLIHLQTLQAHQVRPIREVHHREALLHQVVPVHQEAVVDKI